MTEKQPQLPFLYSDVTPISSERHAAHGLSADRTYAFAAKAGFAPLTIEEFTAAQRFYPIVFTKEGPASPVALLSAARETNDFVAADGTWREGAYVPGYLRRYPFLFLRRNAESDERILCADMASDHVAEAVEDEERAFFKDGVASEAAKTAMDFCKNYELSAERTRRALDEIEERGLLKESAIRVKLGDRTARVEGFRIVDEKKVRELDDEFVAKLVRSGAMGAIYAHLFSLANFSGLGGR